MRILNTTETNLEIERVIDNAKEIVCIITPYIKIHKKLFMKLLRKKDEIDVVIITRRDTDRKLLENLQRYDFNVRTIENLHAKVYLNEKNVIVSSLNLYEFSQINNYEISVLFERKFTKRIDISPIMEILENSKEFY